MLKTLKQGVAVLLVFCLEAPASLEARNLPLFARTSVSATTTFQTQAISSVALWSPVLKILTKTPLRSVRRFADSLWARRVAAVYNRSVGAYMESRGGQVPEIVRNEFQTFLNLLPREGGVLDVGTGPGTYAGAAAAYFHERGERRQVTGIDMADQMVTLASERHRELMSEYPLDFRAMHSAQIRGQLGTENMAGIIDVGALHFSPSEEAENETFRDYFDALTDNGVLFLYERVAEGETTKRKIQPHPGYGGEPIPYNAYAMEDLVRRLEAAGFEVLREYSGIKPHATKPENWGHIMARRPARQNIPSRPMPAISKDFSLMQGPSVVIRPGMEVVPLNVEGPELQAQGETIFIDLHRFSPVQRWSEELRTRDLFDEPLHPGDERTGHTIPEWATLEEKQQALVLSLNTTMGWFMEPNTLLIVNGRPIWREPGKRGIGQESGYQPPDGSYSILSLDADNPGIFDIEVKQGIIVGELPIQNGFGGPRLIRAGLSQVDRLTFNPGEREGFHVFGINGLENPPLRQNSGDHVALAGDDITWGSSEERRALTLYGYTAPDTQVHRRLAIVLIAGDPTNAQKREPALRHAIEILQSLGVSDAILGGASEDVQRLFTHGELPFLKAKGREQSVVSRLLNRNGLRPIGTVLHFFDRSVLPVRSWQSAVAGLSAAAIGSTVASAWALSLVSIADKPIIALPVIMAALAGAIIFRLLNGRHGTTMSWWSTAAWFSGLLPLVLGSFVLGIIQPAAVYLALTAGSSAKPESVISAWHAEGIVDVVETDTTKDIAFVDQEGLLHANLNVIGHLPPWLQRSLLSHEITHKSRVLARLAEGRAVPTSMGKRFFYLVKEEIAAYAAQLQRLPKDFKRPERPVPLDVMMKMAYDGKLQQPEAWLPDVAKAGGGKAILNIPTRRVGPYQLNLVNYRSEPGGKPAPSPWQRHEQNTGVRDLGYPFDAGSFYFGKDLVDWKVAALLDVELGGRLQRIRVNRGPMARYHSLIAPHQAENQLFELADAQAGMDFFNSELEDSRATLCFNSLFAGASQNSKHWHVQFLKSMGFERGVRPLYERGNVQVGMLRRGPAWFVRLMELVKLERSLRDFPAGIVRLQSRDSSALRDTMMEVVEKFRTRNLSVSILERRGDVLIIPIREEYDEKLNVRKANDHLIPLVITDPQVFKTLTRKQIEEAQARMIYPVSTVETVLNDVFGPSAGAITEVMARKSQFPLSKTSEAIEGKTVLVTGAGGQIGQELLRQLAAYKPSKIVLVDMSEHGLENNTRSLRNVIKEQGIACEIVPVLLNMENASRVSQVFAEQRPQVVFHLAGYRLVPIIEKNPEEGVMSNVFGTYNVLQAIAGHAGVERFVFVSSHKAYDPMGIYDKTKRIGELLTRSILTHTDTKFSIVRFENIIDKSPALEEFRTQAENGQPIVLQNPTATRYFMTRKEAASLLLSAVGLGHQGETFILDVGKPLHILDLLKSIILSAGSVFQEGVTYVLGSGRTPEKVQVDRLFEASVVDEKKIGDVYEVPAQFEPVNERSLTAALEILSRSIHHERLSAEAIGEHLSRILTLESPLPSGGVSRIRVFGKDLTPAWRTAVRAGLIAMGATSEYGLQMNAEGQPEFYTTPVAGGNRVRAPVTEKKVGSARVRLILNRRYKPTTTPLMAGLSHHNADCTICSGPYSLQIRTPLAVLRPNNHEWRLDYNLSPIDPNGHFLLTPNFLTEPDNRRPQILLEKDVADLTVMAEGQVYLFFHRSDVSGSPLFPGFTIGADFLSGLATFASRDNYDRATPGSLAAAQRGITLPWDHVMPWIEGSGLLGMDGVFVGRSPDYPATALVVKGQAAKLAQALWPLIQRLQSLHTPFSMYMPLPSGNAGILYHSEGAGASENHIHASVIFRPESLDIEKQTVQPIKVDGQVEPEAHRSERQLLKSAG